MQVDIKLDPEFAALLSNLKRTYGEELAKLNGFADSQLSYTDFIDNFVAKNVADASIDGNANVATKDICSLLSEMSKPHMKLLSLSKIFSTIRKQWGDDVAKEWFEGEYIGKSYMNDAFSASFLPYCFAYDLDTLAKRGLYFIHGFNAQPPEHLETWTDFVGEFVAWTSNRSSGACGIPSFLVYSYYFWKKDCANGFYMKSPAYYRDQEFQRIIYKLNQPYMRINQCVTEEAEVLTPDGFKHYWELKEGDPIYTWKDGKCEIQKVRKVYVGDYDGEMHHYKGRDIDFTVTPNHRILYKVNNSHEFAIKYSKDLIDFKTPLIIPVGMEVTAEDYPISDEELELLTIVLCDGNISKVGNKSPRISVFKSPKRYGGKRIEYLLNKLGFHYTKTDMERRFKGVSDESKAYDLVGYNISALDTKDFAELFVDYDKKVLPEFFKKLSPRQAKLVIDTWAKFDGFVDKRSKTSRLKLQCDNEDIASGLQHLLFIMGKGSKLSRRLIGHNRHEPLYVIPYNRKLKSARVKERVHYKGKVWCPNTENGVVVFRQHDNIFVSGNSAFVNMSIFDHNYLIELFGGRQFPDGSYVIDNVEEIMEYQKRFMEVLAEVRAKNAMTFPVMTYSLLYQDGKFVDEDFAKWCCKHNMQWGDSNFATFSDVTSLSNCCRLTCSIDNIGFFNSIGGTALSVGSIKVNTINLARIAYETNSTEKYLVALRKSVQLTAKAVHSVRHIIKRNVDKGLLPNYTEGLIDMKHQYNTVGIIGIYETLEKFGLIKKDDFGYVSYTDEGLAFADKILRTLSEEIDSFRESNNCDYLINVEQIPGERAAAVLMQKDKIFHPDEKYTLPLYGNQWIPLGVKTTLTEKARVSAVLDKSCNGGAIGHFNIASPFKTFEDAWAALNAVAAAGCNYFAFNYRISVCKTNHSFFGETCPYCGEPKYATVQRIVGFLVPDRNYSKERKAESKLRTYFEW